MHKRQLIPAIKASQNLFKPKATRIVEVFIQVGITLFLIEGENK